MCLNILKTKDIRWVGARPSIKRDNKMGKRKDNKINIEEDNKASIGRNNKIGKKKDDKADTG